MSDKRKTIKVSESEFEELKDEKPDGVSWGYYLTQIRTVNKVEEE
jgi:hypothetical protein